MNPKQKINTLITDKNNVEKKPRLLNISAIISIKRIQFENVRLLLN